MKIFKWTILIIFQIFFQMCFANDVSVDINPTEPIAGENFYVTFSVRTDSELESSVSFTPDGVNILGKSVNDSSNTTIINGKISSFVQRGHVFELSANKKGMVTLRNVKINIGGKISEMRDVVININGNEKPVEAFLEASTSKNKVFLGEGVNINYYLYFRDNISDYSINQFPKLNNFIKRFHQGKEGIEAVNYKGREYRRILIYKARLYPEKLGTIYLDSMSLNAQIIEEDNSSPFGMFRMGSQRVKTKELISPKVAIEVIPLPLENKPANFSGLVGAHEVNWIMAKSKFLVNEPIEFKFEVKGEGALENFNGPLFYQNSNLDIFDTKSSIQETELSNAKKTFEYTLLPKGPFIINPSEFDFSYFDPSLKKYIIKKINLSGLEVSGTATKVESNENSYTQNLPTNSDSEISLTNHNEVLSNPIFKFKKTFDDYKWTILNGMLLVLVIISIAKLFKDDVKFFEFGFHKSKSKFKEEFFNIKKNGANYSDLYKIITAIPIENKNTNTLSLSEIINLSSISADSKKYFLELVKYCESKNFNKDLNLKSLPFEKKHFKELEKWI